jgi:hypothetical protein
MTGNTQSLDDTRPEQTVHNAWVDTFEELGVDRDHGEVIVRAVFADDQLLHESLGATEITAVVRENLREIDFKPYIEEYSTEEFTEADEQQLREELLDKLRAGLDGDLYGPSFADRDIALAGPEESSEPFEGPGTGQDQQPPTPAKSEDDEEEEPFTGEPSLVESTGPETTESPDTIEGGSLRDRAVANMESPADSVPRRSGVHADDSENPPEEVEQAVDALVDLAHNDNIDVRVSAIEALGNIGANHPHVSARIIDIFVEMTTESDSTVAKAIAQELGRVVVAHSAAESAHSKGKEGDENV